jgi:ribose transport system ATP-binding protein
VTRVVDLSGAPEPSTRHPRTAPLLHVRGVTKAFGGTKALRGVDLEVRPGEIHGLIGQNGCGKSTLIKILSGYHSPDAGEVELGGAPMRLPLRPGEAQRHGLSFVHQDLALAPGMTVLENLRLGRYDTTAYGRVRWRRERASARSLLAGVGLPVDPDTPIRNVPHAERALIAFARAAHELAERPGGGVLILDEATASLPASSVKLLAEAARRLIAGGSSVLFVSHRLDEVLDLCDRISVVRDGRLVACLTRSEADEARLIELMLGRELGQLYPPKSRPRDEAALSTSSLTGDVAEDVSIDVQRGEILGITGLVGMGHDELPYLLFGARRLRAGSISVAGEAIERPSPASLRRAGVALLPADRKRASGSLGATVLENVTLPVLGEFFSGGLLRHRKERAHVLELLARFEVRPPAATANLASLSGGNQQKALLAKWLQRRPQVLILHEPTQGVDVGSRARIFSIIQEVAADGVAIVIVSSEHEDLAHLCNRVLVMRRGRVGVELAGSDVSEERIVEQCYVNR